MEIIKGYWGNKTDEITSENKIKKHIGTFEPTKVFIGLKQIKHFKFIVNNNRMNIFYSLKANTKMKYYANLLNHSICVNKNTIVFLNDKNWLDYDTQTINEETIKLLK